MRDSVFSAFSLCSTGQAISEHSVLHLLLTHLRLCLLLLQTPPPPPIQEFQWVAQRCILACHHHLLWKTLLLSCRKGCTLPRAKRCLTYHKTSLTDGEPRTSKGFRTY